MTILVIGQIMLTLDLEHRLSGSGDKHVLFVKMRKTPHLAEEVLNINAKLRKSFADVGLSLKMEET